MKIKLAPGLNQHGAAALGLHAPALYAALGSRRVVIAELASTQRLEIATDEEKAPEVTLQVKALEVAGEGQEETVRSAMRALHLLRTAVGTFTEDHDVELAENTLAGCEGDLVKIEAARLHVAIEHWSDYARRAAKSEVPAGTLRKELKTIGDALAGVLYSGAFSGT